MGIDTTNKTNNRSEFADRKMAYLSAIVAGMLLMPILCADTVTAQIRVRHAQDVQIRGGGFREFFRVGPEDEPSQPNPTESGATLKTDPDLESTLETAERFKNDGNYRIAIQLWQAVLQRSGDALYSRDGVLYFSLVRQVESILASLPPEGLAAYRVVADAAAKGIMAEANDPYDVTALNQVVRSYFISSLGDDAAFQLGCIYLDRFDFIGARRMFEKISQNYPDSSIPREQVLLRIALCQSYLGETDAARQSLAAAEALIGDSSQLSQIRLSIGELANRPTNSVVDANWSMRLGDARRFGVMPALPSDVMDTDLVAVWQYYFEPADVYRWNDAKGKILTGQNAADSTAAGTVSSVEERLIERWQDKNWRPAGELLFDQHRIYFKSAADLTVWDANQIEEMIAADSSRGKIDDSISWRSVWRNVFEIDEATQMEQIVGTWGGYGSRNGSKIQNDVPTSIAEVQLFGDEIQQQVSIVNGIVYSLEGKAFDDDNSARRQRVTPQFDNSFRRVRSNFLTAYDAVTGQVDWTLPHVTNDSPAENLEPAATSEAPFIAGGGFMSAPIGFGELILVPVNNGGAISVHALDPKNGGRTVWKSFLCDEPDSGAEPWSAINLTLDGSDLFVNCGMGVVFVIDPATGLVRFAKRYARVGTTNSLRRQTNWMVNRLKFSGWSNDVIIPYGRQMICFSSDTDQVVAYDRNNGDLIWRSEMSPIGTKVDYLLGIHNDVLYAAGRETIVAFDLQGEGRMIWGAEPLFDGKQSLGRGVLTPEGIYMPVKNSIYHFSLSGIDEPGKLLARVQVNLGTSAPVGNLYSDGKRFWVHGGNRLYVLGPEP